MLLGTQVKRVTDALGIKQCEGCKYRQKLLDEISRRGFLSGMAFLGVHLNKSFWKAVGPNADTSTALRLARVVNTLQAGFLTQTDAYGSKADVWGAKGLQKVMDRHVTEQTAAGEWARSLNLESDNIQPGWMIDYATKPMGYRIVIAATDPGKRAVYITDQVGVIYRADYEGTPPSAHSLSSASVFPNAVPFDQFIGAERSTPLSRFLSRVGIPDKVLAQGTGCDMTCCKICTACAGCSNIGRGCCIYNCGSLDCGWCRAVGSCAGPCSTPFGTACITCNKCACACGGATCSCC